MSASLTIPDIRQSIYINVPTEKVYTAITTADAWNSWFTQATTIDFTLGGKVTLR